MKHSNPATQASAKKMPKTDDDDGGLGRDNMAHDTHRSETQKIKAMYAPSSINTNGQPTSLDDFDFMSTLGTVAVIGCLDPLMHLCATGIGTIGRVQLVKHIHSERFHAMKVLKKSEAVRLKLVDHLKEERRIWSTLSHPFIVTMLVTPLLHHSHSVHVCSHDTCAGTHPSRTSATCVSASNSLRAENF